MNHALSTHARRFVRQPAVSGGNASVAHPSWFRREPTAEARRSLTQADFWSAIGI